MILPAGWLRVIEQSNARLAVVESYAKATHAETVESEGKLEFATGVLLHQGA